MPIPSAKETPRSLPCLACSCKLCRGTNYMCFTDTARGGGGDKWHTPHEVHVWRRHVLTPGPRVLAVGSHLQQVQEDLVGRPAPRFIHGRQRALHTLHRLPLRGARGMHDEHSRPARLRQDQDRRRLHHVPAEEPFRQGGLDGC